jgi:bifunctional enzyme CysN/CysC
MDMLRFATAGSVDDGKSTLIGRLLFDSKSIFVDQLESISTTSKMRGDDYTDLSLLTDGLRAEREQGITIDVAYRYFASQRRKFIVADTPGHTQYTRNMVTGASTADLAIVLVDARKGILEQSRRHAAIASLLRVPHVVLAVNKMDLVDWSEERFEEIRADFMAFASKLNFPDLTAIPLSALSGGNVVSRASEAPWYEGPPLLYHLETVHISSDRNLTDVRFPVQYVIRPQRNDARDYRGYAGRVSSGVIAIGDEIIVLPSGLTSRVIGIDSPQGAIEQAFPPMSVTLRLQDDIDISRGDMICRPRNRPHVSQDIDGMVCWMDSSPLQVGASYTLLHTTRSVRAVVRSIDYELDIDTLHRKVGTDSVGLNQIARVVFRATQPLIVDDYSTNRETGAFIVIDESTNRTVGAGVIALRES